MRKIKFSDVLPHGVAVVVFLLVTLTFFSPIFFENKSLEQQDIQQHIASAKSLRDYREATGQEGLWAPSMFSGMPAYLVNLQWSDGAVVTLKKVLTVFLPHPVCNIFAAFISFYILLLAFRIRPYLAMAGALAFGLSSYMIIGLSVGHNARIGAIAFMPLVMAGIHLAFSGKRILGLGVTAAGLALQLRENHLQITYYLILIVAVYGLIQFIIAVREKQLKAFAMNLGILLPAALIASATFFGQFWAISEYKQYSIRGPSELGKATSDGLTKSYAFSYNYGVWEPMTLLIPQFYGGGSLKAFVQDEQSESYKALVKAENNLANRLAAYTSEYWGPQTSTIGPYYGGAIIVFLFVLGIVFAERKYVYWLVPLSLLSLMLSWGDSFASFNYFMFDYFPGYNSFRSHSFALIIILFAMPLLGMLGLEKFLMDGLTPTSKKKLLVAFGIVGGGCLLLLLFAGMGTFLRDEESKLPPWFLNALQSDRRGLLRDDALRSLAFIASIFILLYFNVPKKAPMGFYAFLIFMTTIDLAVVDKRYFTKDNFKRKRDATYFAASDADAEILKDKSYYRVFNLQEPWSNGARTSYYHHSLSGYHGAKLRRYQDLYDSCISRETQTLIKNAQAGNADMREFGVLNMLNTKYILFGTDRGAFLPNDAANGPAWFAREVMAVNSPAEALQKVGEIDTKRVAVIENANPERVAYDSLGTITLTDLQPPYLKYEALSGTGGVAVFSEIFYPKGWHAFIDNKEVPILRADYVLRALEIPAGKHMIEFKFEPKPYTVGNKVTMASGWVLLILVIGSVGWTWRKSGES